MVAGEFLHQFIGHHCASQSKRRGDGRWMYALVYCAWLLVRRKILRLYFSYQREVARCLHVWDGAGEGGSAEER